MISRIIDTVKDAINGKPLKLRSSKWKTVRNEYLKDHGFCVCCGSNKNLQIHHKKPYHIFPELELDPSNLITLCEDTKGSECHLKIGHLGNWHNYNPNVENDARECLFAKIKKDKNYKIFANNLF